MSSELIGLLGFAVLVLLLLARVPVGIAMIAVSVVGYGLVVRPDAALARLGSDAFSSTASYALSVIPLFVLMGLLMAQAALGRDRSELRERHRSCRSGVLDHRRWCSAGGIQR
jgi:TRAP-type mannitol/chloroaromatic compound transport system permease large subunit